MLVKIVDHKQKGRFVNAVYVKAVHEKGVGKCQIEVSGWASKLTVDSDADTVAQAINAAMPSPLDALLAAEDEQAQEQQAAATIAVIG